MTAPTMGLPERLRRLAEYQDLPGIKTIMEDAAQELDTVRSENFLLNHKLAGEMQVANKFRQRLADAPHEEGCMLGFHYEDATVGVCDCWKAGL